MGPSCSVVGGAPGSYRAGTPRKQIRLLPLLLSACVIDSGNGDIDEGYPDTDGDGRADCLDASCPTLEVGAAGAVSIVEACEGGSSVSKVADPWDVDVKWRFSRASGGGDQSASTPVIGNLDDDDGDGDEDDDPEVVVNYFNSSFSQTSIVALDGATGLEKWSYAGAGFASGVAIADIDSDGSPDVVGYDSSYRIIALEGDGTLKWTSTVSGSASALPLVTVADLDNDGRPEVLADNQVVDGYTGRSVFTMDRGTATYTIAAVGDVDLDGDQEVAFAGKLYDSDGTLLWSTGETGTYGFWPIIIQADGEAEVAWGAYQTFVTYELDGTQLWSVPMDDTSGLAGCSGYDVDGDGALEVLFADETTFKILDGGSGATNYTYSDHASGTAFEYPSVADIDHDGHAEILFVSNMYSGSRYAGVTALEHAGAGWPAAGSTWAIPDLAITNINSDGSVPATPDPYWNSYNVYRARVAADDPAGVDLAVRITDVCVADCDYGPVELAIR